LPSGYRRDELLPLWDVRMNSSEKRHPDSYCPIQIEAEAYAHVSYPDIRYLKGIIQKDCVYSPDDPQL
jgi:hypothetical protein